MASDKSDNAPRLRTMGALNQDYWDRKEQDEQTSYQRYVDSLEACPGCGRVDSMDNITGQLLCASCYLDEQSDDEDYEEDWDA